MTTSTPSTTRHAAAFHRSRLSSIPRAIWPLLLAAAGAAPLPAQRAELGPPYLVAHEGFVIPSAVAVDEAAGRVLVADAGSHRVHVAALADLAGTPAWSEYGHVADLTLPEALHGPQGVAVDGAGNAYVVDTFGNEVQLYRRDPATGSYTYDAGFAATTRNSVASVPIQLPRDVAVGPAGEVYLLDSGNARILVASGPNDASWEVWRQSASWANPYGIDVATDGTVYVADTDNHRIWKLPQSGTDVSFGHYGSGNGQLRHPRDVAAFDDGSLAVADTDNHRVVLLAADGTHQLTLAAGPLFDTPQKVEVTASEHLLVADAGGVRLVAYLGPTTMQPYDLYVRDFVADTGVEPSAAGIPLISPDILVRRQADVDLAEAAARGLDSYVFERPDYGRTNAVYLAVRNRGTHPVAGALARFYWADPASALQFPDDWHSEGFYRSYAQGPFWTHLVRTTAHDDSSAVAAYDGGVYVAGFTAGTLPGESPAGTEDGYLRKLDHAGNVLWTRQLGTTVQERVYAVAVDATGVYVAGETRGGMSGASQGGNDGFVRRYDHDGNQEWTAQIGTAGADRVSALAADATGVYVAGTVEGALPGQPRPGTLDAFIRKYDTNGTVLWTDQFGTAQGDEAFGLAVHGSEVYVTGHQTGVVRPGDRDIFARRYSQSGTFGWQRIYGSNGTDRATGIAVDASGVYISGFTDGVIQGQAPLGGEDALLIAASVLDGKGRWLRQLGTAARDSTQAVVIGSAGPLVVGLTLGQFPGQPTGSGMRAFVRQYTSAGAESWTCQYGTTGFDGADAAAVFGTDLYVSGRQSGTTSGAPDVDGYVRKLDLTAAGACCLDPNTPDNSLVLPLIAPQGAEVFWTRQEGGAHWDSVKAMATRGSSVFAGGFVDSHGDGNGRFFGQAKVQAFDASGSELWADQFGAGDSTGVLAMAANAEGVYAAGVVDGALPGQTFSGGVYDGFVRKYHLGGGEAWTRQIGNGSHVRVWAAAVRGSELYLAGDSDNGPIPGATVTESGEAFVRRYDGAGNALWTRQFGGASGGVRLQALATDATGIYVGGTTWGHLPGQQPIGHQDGFVRKYDDQGNVLWTRQFGTATGDSVLALAADATGIYAVGFTAGNFPGFVKTGVGNDAFVRKYDADGMPLWTRQFGSDANDVAQAAVADGTGVYVGGYTGGALPGHGNLGGNDAYLRRFEADGGGAWSRQMGSAENDEALGLAADPTAIYFGGFAVGALPGQAAQQNGDWFVRAQRAATADDGVVVVGPIYWRPPAPESTTARDGQVHLMVRLVDLYDPTMPGAGLDQVRASNNVAIHPASIPGDGDGDGVYDGNDNCRLTSNPGQEDLDGDGIGDVCDNNIDGDSCINLYDPKPEDINDPDTECLLRPLDPALTRDGRLAGPHDPRLDDPRLHALLEGIFPEDQPTCGPVDCPPPRTAILDGELRDLMAEIYPHDFGLDDQAGFGGSGEWLPDLDRDEYSDLAIGAALGSFDPDRPRSGAVILVSGKTGEQIARIAGQDPSGGFGAALALLDDHTLAVGAPGDADVAGSVAIVDLKTFEVVRRYSTSRPGDRFGASLVALGDFDRDGRADLAAGAPGADGRGAVYLIRGDGRMQAIGSGAGAGDAFGETLVAVGDVNRDGMPELLVGAPGDAEGQERTAGTVVLLDLSGKTLWSHGGAETGDRFGAAIAAVSGDRDRATVTEVLVGAPGWENETGRAYVVEVGGEVRATLTGSGTGQRFGAAVGLGPDLNGDGLRTLVVSESVAAGRGKPVRSTFYER